MLLYHAIGTPLAAAPYSLTVSVKQFEEQMRWLRDQPDIEGVSLEAGVQLLSANPSRRLVAVTFDDGYLDNLTVAAPLLSKLGLPCTVFVTASYLTRQPSSRPLFLSIDDLRVLSEIAGVSIGAHGYSHRPLTRLSQFELNTELGEAKALLEGVIRRRVATLSYPHGAVNAQVIEAAKACGYDYGATSFIGLNRRGRSPWLLSRTEITGKDNLEDFCRKVRGDYDWYGLKQRLYWPIPQG